jgi:hypothetical protein
MSLPSPPLPSKPFKPRIEFLLGFGVCACLLVLRPQVQNRLVASTVRKAKVDLPTWLAPIDTHDAVVVAAGAPFVVENSSESSHWKNGLWETSTNIPPWMKRYFEWHRSERAKLTVDNWRERRYLVLRCLRTDFSCGGASDRLKAIPYLLLLANQTNRLFFIKWSRPAPLEEFLVPPVGGLNWTVPAAVDFEPLLIGRGGAIYTSKKNETGIIAIPENAFWAATDRMVVEVRLVGVSFNEVYDENRQSPSEATFERVYSDVWRVLFEPSPELALVIAATYEKLGLTPGGYVSAHVRGQYNNNRTGDTALLKNALNCASSLLPGAPIYVASDSLPLSTYAFEYGTRVLNHSVVANRREQPPLHIDRGKNFLSQVQTDWDKYPASAYYDTFVDLYLLSGGRCFTYGIGGYGYWASLISQNVSCSIHHNKRCRWTPRQSGYVHSAVP